MLKVLQINDYPPGASGGAEVLLARTVELLRGHAAIDLFTADDLPDGRLTARRYVDNPVARHALAEKLEASRPDVVHLHNFYHRLSPGILTALRRYRRRRPLRVVMTAHDYHLVCPNSGGNWFPAGPRSMQPIDAARLGSLRYLLSRRWDHRGWLHSALKTTQHLWNYRWRDVQRALDLVICPSRFVEGLVRQVRLPTRWLPHPLPPAVVTPERSGPLRLVYAGRLEPEKGLNEFLTCLPTDFDGTLTVIGDGQELEHCRQTCRDRGLERRVVFRGRLPHAETLAEIARAHVLVLASRCLESYGLTLVEALAAGTNLLASDRGAMREIVEEAGVGFLFPPGDATALAAQLRRIRDQHRTGTLNRFDVSAFLRERSEDGYRRGLLGIYRGEAA